MMDPARVATALSSWSIGPTVKRPFRRWLVWDAHGIMVELRHFRSFVAVAEEGKIGGAASRLFITQPALSRVELGGGVPDLETLRRLGNAMGVRFHVIVGDEHAEQEENLRLTG